LILKEPSCLFMPYYTAFPMHINSVIREALKGRNILTKGEALGTAKRYEPTALKGRNTLGQ